MMSSTPASAWGSTRTPRIAGGGRTVRRAMTGLERARTAGLVPEADDRRRRGRSCGQAPAASSLTTTGQPMRAAMAAAASAVSAATASTTGIPAARSRSSDSRSDSVVTCSGDVAMLPGSSQPRIAVRSGAPSTASDGQAGRTGPSASRADAPRLPPGEPCDGGEGRLRAAQDWHAAARRRPARRSPGTHRRRSARRRPAARPAARRSLPRARRPAPAPGPPRPSSSGRGSRGRAARTS